MADFDRWECPDCGYQITDLQMQLATTNFPCPRCKVRVRYPLTLGDFKSLPANTEKEAE